MNSKRLIAFLWILLIGSGSLFAQNTFSFNVTTSTAVEANTTVIAGYVKADAPPAASDSVQIVLVSGNPRPTHINTQNIYKLYFPAGADSIPFSIQLYDDTFPEKPEYIHYQLNAYGTTDSIGANRTLIFVLTDNDLPATIGFVIDSGSAYLHDGSFTVCETINNPNPFYVRYRRYTYDGYTDSSFYHTTAGGGVNYFYNRDTVYAPPGISTLCQDIVIVPNSNLDPDKTMVCVLFNVDGNNISDSLFFFTIKNDNFYYPPSVSFDQSGITIQKDTAVILSVPITTINPNHRSFSFLVDTFAFQSTSSFDSTAGGHVYLNNNYFNHPGGTWHDTMRINILDNHLVDDTSIVVLRIKGVVQNTSADTLYHITIIDTGALFISFKGAGFAHLKTDSIGYVQVYSSAPAKYPITADIKYLNGDAVMGVDFLWSDTQVTFPANAFDTISLPVIMLKNHIHDGNKQINFTLSNVQPATVLTDIVQYTYFIIDDDSTAVYPAGIAESDVANFQVYPNPVESSLHISSERDIQQVNIYNSLGALVIRQTPAGHSTTIDTEQLSAGMYYVSIQDRSGNYTRKIVKD